MSMRFTFVVLVLGLAMTACGAAAPKPDAAPTEATAPAADAPAADAPAAAPAPVAAAPAPGAAATAEATCPVSGEKFTPTADSPRSEYKGTTYVFCCGGCKKKFDAAPDKFVAAATKDGKPCDGDCADKDCGDKHAAPKAEDAKPAAPKTKG